METDHDLLIHIDTQLDVVNQDLKDVQSHVAVMNNEQGVQAKQIVRLETQVASAMIILTAIAIAVIGQLVEMFFRYRKNGNN